MNATPTVPVVFAAHVTETGALIVIEQAVPVAPLESVTFTWKVPEAVGVPVIAPVEAFNASPAGSVPTMEYV